MTLTLVAGPGGAGSTTVALALAQTVAAAGETVLITAAPQLPDGSGSPPAPTVLRPDVHAFVERHTRSAQDAGVLPAEIAALPGVDLLATLTAVAEVLATRPSAELIVDAGARAVELVGILERLGRFTDALVPQALRILGRVTGKTSGGGLAVWDGLLDAALPGATALASCSAVLVLPAQPHRLPQALLLPAQLSLFGIGVRAVVTRVEGGVDAASVMGPAASTITVCWPADSAQPPDLTPIVRHELASRSIGDDTVVSTSDGFDWPLPLPGARRDQLDLERDDDALLISVGDVVRRVELPSVLQRCSVGSARFSDGVLTIGFAPDPSRWPAWARQPVATGAGDE